MPIVGLTTEQEGIIDTPQEENLGETRGMLQDERDLGSRSHQWLNDRHITVAQHLKQQHSETSGLQPTTLQLTRTTDVNQSCKLIHCLNASSNHWLTVSTIICPPGVINVHDTMHLGRLLAYPATNGRE